MSATPAVWFPTVRTGTGTDVFTERLVAELKKRGLRAEITWLPLRAEYAPWTVPIPKTPTWATVAHVNTWLHYRFIPKTLPVVATIHHAVHHPDARAFKGTVQAAYHRHWIAPNERRVLRKANKVVAVSQFVADTTRRTLLDAPMQVIYNGVDTELFKPGNRVRQEGEPFHLLYVGAWKALKGVDLLAPIMRELGDGFELSYTGGPIADKDKSDMPRNMHDIGRLHDDIAVATAMRNADALLFPSRSEGFGLVAAEAMACGLPVVATHSSSLIEIIENQVTGMLCESDNVGKFTEQVRQLSSDPEKLIAMGKDARNKVQTTYNKNIMCERYILAYQSDN